MKNQSITWEGRTFISAGNASKVSKYSRDYIGQLCRTRGIECQRIQGSWFVDKEQLLQHASRAGKWTSKDEREKEKKSRPSRIDPIDSIPLSNGDELISTRRAAKLMGYTVDYIAQLARESTITAQEIGGKWFVSRKELDSYKQEKDSQLAQVQTQSVGLAKQSDQESGSDEKISSGRDSDLEQHFSYFSDDRPLIPEIKSVEETSHVAIKKEHSAEFTPITDSHNSSHMTVNDAIEQKREAFDSTEVENDQSDVFSAKNSRDFSDTNSTHTDSDEEKAERIPIRTFSSAQQPAFLNSTDNILELRPEESLSERHSGLWMIIALILVAIVALGAVLFMFPLGQIGEKTFNSTNLADPRNSESGANSIGFIDSLFSVFESKAHFHQD